MNSSAYISYHHDDQVIGEVIFQQLKNLAQKGQGAPSLDCFLDVRDIAPGVPWQPVIDEALTEMDWLIVVFTGEQSVYCGYEIGTFKQIHAMEMAEKPPMKRIMGLYDVEADLVPVVLRNSQNTPVPSVARAVEPDDVRLTTDEVGTWFQSKLGRFLVSFCNYKGIYTSAHAMDDPGTYAVNIATAAKQIANAFALAKATDVKEETQVQIGFEVNISTVGTNRLRSIPTDAVVVGNSLTFAMIGLNIASSDKGPPSLTWGRLKELLNLGRGEVPWLHKVEADIILAADSLAVSNDDVTFRGRTGKIFRPILSRHKLFVNGDRRFYVLLVETLDRRFTGTPQTSLLLTSIILASRWRFTYFEKWGDTIERTFGKNASVDDFTDGCRQLFYNIEWIEHESAELGANDSKALVDAFGYEHRARVERFFSDWDKAKKKLYEILPGPGSEIASENRGVARDAVIMFLEATRAQNNEFLELSISMYSEVLGSEMTQDRQGRA